MEPANEIAPKSEGPGTDIRTEISALWTSVMFCYAYGDIIGFFKPGRLSAILSGKMALFPTTQGVLLGVAILMSVPAVMIFLSLILKPKINRVLNIVFGVIYTLVILATLPGAWLFYIFLGMVEMALTVSIVWRASNWPRSELE